MMNKMTDAQFEEYVKEGIDSLPEWVHSKLTNVVFLIEDVPSPLERKENGLTDREMLFGLYEGVPLSERGDSSPEMPDRITIFKKPILGMYENAEDIRTCILNTVWHEVAHYFGHDEDWVREEEIRRGKSI